MDNDRDAILKAFMQKSDPKQIALVGVQALTVLAGELTAKELSAFLQDASAAADRAQLSRRPPAGQRRASGPDALPLRRSGPIR
ncbi:MAG TPA: hypothetical protein VNW97_14410 [Candidatus Saccharimonadales bacterium]|nr:hypothetical protein [Candidatus Saccharimonadales bacterium]